MCLRKVEVKVIHRQSFCIASYGGQYLAIRAQDAAATTETLASMVRVQQVKPIFPCSRSENVLRDAGVSIRGRNSEDERSMRADSV